MNGENNIAGRKVEIVKNNLGRKPGNRTKEKLKIWKSLRKKKRVVHCRNYCDSSRSSSQSYDNLVTIGFQCDPMLCHKKREKNQHVTN